jgi:hypothetical protein
LAFFIYEKWVLLLKKGGQIGLEMTQNEKAAVAK